MVRRISEVLRIIIISPETLILLLIVAASNYWTKPFEVTGQHFIGKDKLWEFIPTIPLGLLYYGWNLSSQLQAPVESANRELYDWELYWALKYRIIAAMAWAGLSAICSVTIWMFSGELTASVLGLLFFSSVGVSLVVVVTEMLALFALKEIMTK
jgi:hypothetical protein